VLLAVVLLLNILMGVVLRRTGGSAVPDNDARVMRGAA